MKLHEDNHQLATAIRITAQELHIPEKFVEKDYWICQILQRLSRLPQASSWIDIINRDDGYATIYIERIG